MRRDRGTDLRRPEEAHGTITLRDYRTDFSVMIFRLAAILRRDRPDPCGTIKRRVDLGTEFCRVDEFAVDEARQAVVLLISQILFRFLDLQELLVVVAEGVLRKREQDERAPTA